MEAILKLIYLAAAVCFIFGLKRLSHPRTAVSGNQLAAVGMLVAIVATAVGGGILTWQWMLMGIVIGSAIGAVIATKVKMTAMPEMVALLNGFGGAASALVAGAEYIRYMTLGDTPPVNITVTIQLSILIGTVTFSGSLIAFGKLREIVTGTAVTYPLQKTLNAILFLGTIALIVWLSLEFPLPQVILILAGVGLLLGVLSVIPIGGADMPVVIALLNSYSGLAASMTGFVINNHGLIISGALVGASGLILTAIMCKAMNRSLTNVLFGVLGPSEGGPTADEVYAGKIKATSAEEVAMILDAASRVVIVPGYGMAVSQAQHAVRDLGTLLEKKGATVEYAIHPVAGRMPGHMNVLLAEADVEYEKLKEMDEINPTMSQVDVAIVVGANDVVNPVARTDPNSPIAGMPIIDVDKAKTVVVVKRSLSPGFAKIPNPLFAADNALMFFSDGKKAFIEMVEAVKETM